MAKGLRYRPEIDGLRAIAVSAVLIYHLGTVFIDVNLLSGGFLGVDIFFVISGYLISNIVLSGLERGTFSLADFYRRRVRRILPVFFVVVIASLPFAWLLFLPEETQAFASSMISSIFFVSNIWFFSSDPYWTAGLSRPFLHTWSLGVEEQFYLLFPGFLLLVFRFGRNWMAHIFVALFMLSLLYAHFESGRNMQAAFFLLPSRMWELSAGILLSIAERNQRWQSGVNTSVASCLSTIGLSLIIIPMFLFSSGTRHPSLITLIPVAGVVLVIAFARNNFWIIRLLSLKPVVALGLISYGLYLWHYPVFVFAHRFVDVPSHASAVLLVMLCLLLSTISYFFIEQPARSSSSISFHRLFAALFLCLLSVLPILIMASRDGFRNRYPEFLLSQESKPVPLPNYEWSYADTEKPNNIILVGDSHMMAIASELKALALENGFNYAVSTERGCQLIADTRRVLRSNRQPTHCTEILQAERLEFLRSASPSFVILGGRLPLVVEEKAFENQTGGNEKRMVHFLQNPEATLGTRSQRRKYIAAKYLETVEDILSMGHIVVLLYPIPEVGWHVPQKLASMVGGDWSRAREIARANPIETEYEVFTERTRRSYELLDAISLDSILRVYPEKLFCNIDGRNKCSTHNDEYVYYRDSHHPSAYGASLIANSVMEAIMNSGFDPRVN